MNYEELKVMAAKRGFEISLLDRGSRFRRIATADRFEIWLKGKYFESKISYRGTLQEAVDEAVPEVERLMNESEPLWPR